MNNQNMPLSEEEQKEYDRLLKTYKSAGGNADNPLDDTTLRLFRGEAEKQPEKSISPDQIGRLRKLFKKKIGEIKPE